MKVSCIIPAYNEGSSIAEVVRTVRKVKSIDEIIVVDDGSRDDTAKKAEKEGAKVVRHEKNLGKGAAIKTGYKSSSGDILLFLDADLQALTPKKITSMIHPLRNDEADFVKTSFSRSRGRVTELVAKPLLRITHPEVGFSQPLSGQFAIKRGLMEELKIDERWGVDIQILLQLVKKGVRIEEVDIGLIAHKKQPLESLTIMSEEVMRSILSEMGVIANKHKLIIFDFDKTIIEESSIEIVAEELGFSDKLKELRERKEKGEIRDSDITLALVKLLKGKRRKDLEPAIKRMHLTKNVKKVVERLRKRKYEVAIVSLAFSPVVEHFAEKLGIRKDDLVCPHLLEDGRGRFTGEVIAMTTYNSECCDTIICKGEAAKELMMRLETKPEECIAVADGKSDQCLFRECGLGLAYRAEKDIGDVAIADMSEILIHAD